MLKNISVWTPDNGIKTINTLFVNNFLLRKKENNYTRINEIHSAYFDTLVGAFKNTNEIVKKNSIFKFKHLLNAKLYSKRE